jgi:hypothetical protein
MQNKYLQDKYQHQPGVCEYVYFTWYIHERGLWSWLYTAIVRHLLGMCVYILEQLVRWSSAGGAGERGGGGGGRAFGGERIREIMG